GDGDAFFDAGEEAVEVPVPTFGLFDGIVWEPIHLSQFQPRAAINSGHDAAASGAEVDGEANFFCVQDGPKSKRTRRECNLKTDNLTQRREAIFKNSVACGKTRLAGRQPTTTFCRSKNTSGRSRGRCRG